MLNKISQTQKRQILHVFSHMWNLDKKKRHGQKTGTTGGEASRRWKGEREDMGENMI
jgi:hypothetical protein